MAFQPMPANCDRARAWVSLRLDGELSELEDALLSAHLRRCAYCCEYEATVATAVLVLRDQPLEQVEHPVAIPGRHRTLIRPIAVARVAAVVAAVVGVTAVLSTQSAHAPTGSLGKAVSIAPLADEARDFRTGRVIQLGGKPPQGTSLGSFGPVLSGRNGS